MSVAQILPYVVAGCQALGLIITVIMLVFKSKKAGNNYGVIQLFTEIPSLIAQAEEMFGAGKGVSKCQWVLTQLQYKALQNNIKISEEALTQQINATVEATKKVNVS